MKTNRKLTTFPSNVCALSWLTAAMAGCASGGEGEEALAVNQQPLTALVSAPDLAFHFAPLHTQDVNKATMNGKPDYLSRVDYDGDFVTTNNWDRLAAFSTPAFAYYAVTESASHWFIYYQFYHPRDWGTSFAQEHENDAEGALVFVRKDGSLFGKFEGMVTQAHGEFFPYRDASVALTPGTAGKAVNVVNMVTTAPETHARPATYQEWGGHGFYACGTHITNCVRADDGIRYVPSLTTAGVPPAVIPNGTQVSVSYRLIDITQAGGLFARRNDTQTFLNGKTFRGDHSGGCGGGNFDTLTCVDNSAGAIWGWNPSFGLEPAGFVRQYFNFGAATPPSSSYLRNDFQCGHDLCQQGSPLQGGEFGCVPCATQVCNADPFCCTTAWDGACVAEVSSICNLGCVSCAHDVCAQGAALTRGCSQCSAEVCAVDSFCCTNSWDEVCTSEARSVCGLCQ